MIEKSEEVKSKIETLLNQAFMFKVKIFKSNNNSKLFYFKALDVNEKKVVIDAMEEKTVKYT